MRLIFALCFTAVSVISAASITSLFAPFGGLRRRALASTLDAVVSERGDVREEVPARRSNNGIHEDMAHRNGKGLDLVLLSASSCCGGAPSSLTHRPCNELIIGTRGSPLALAQARETKGLFEAAFPELNITIKEIMTQGDAILDQALSEIGGKGLFTKELDRALLDGSVDLCVHSMKDVPTELPEGTELTAYLCREDTRDVFISNRYKSIRELPDGAVVGSSSLRRQAQILAVNPTLRVVNFRGNVQTRLKKLCNGDVDATILAHAGLRRLKMHDLIRESTVISWEDMLPAVAQGAIGIQCRSDDANTIKYVRTFSDFPTELAVQCERAFLAELEGNCRTPIAGQAMLLPNNTLVFRGLVATCDGTDILPIEMAQDDCVTVALASALGATAAKELKRIAGPERMKKFHDSMDQYTSKNGQIKGWAKRN